MGWTVRQRLVVAFFIMSILMAIAGGFSLYYMSRIQASTVRVLQENQPILNDMAAIERNILFHSLKVGQYVTTGNRAHLRAVEDLIHSVEVHLADLESRTRGTEDELVVEGIRGAYETYTVLSEEMLAFYQQHPDDTASIEGRQMRIGALLENALIAPAEYLYEAKQREAEELAQAGVRLNQIFLRVIVVTIVVMLGLFVTVGVSIDRSVAVPIARLSEATRRIMAGDLGARVAIRTRDEIGLLARTFNDMTARLQGLVGTLEQRIAERTRDLEKRAVQLEAAARVARDALEIRDVRELLDRVVHLISERFGFYHAGIFLLDDRGEYAVLRAASSEGGKRMLERGHKLAVGKVGIVGYVAGSGEPRIALDVGADAVFFDNPDLPRTRSEMALPLKVRNRVIGVLDVQSEEPAAFTSEDVAALQTMADQIALAIENARLLEESYRTLQELERLYGERAREAWRLWTARRPSTYRYTGVEVEPLPTPPAQPSAAEGDGHQLTVPLRLRGQVIGSILLRRTGEQPPWSPEEQRLAEEMGEQIALALESARLLEESRSRAIQEQMLSGISSILTRSLDMETLLHTAVEELARLPEVTEVAVYLGTGREVGE